MVYTSDRMSPFNASPRLVVGMGLVVFGALLLLGRLNIVDTEYVLRLWPVILIALGLQQFFSPRTPERGFPVHGVVWMAIGGLLLLNSLNILRASIWELFWPAILIAVGVRLITRTPRVRVRHRMSFGDNEGAQGATGTDGTTESSRTYTWESAPRADAGAQPGATSEGADAGSIFAVLSAVKRVSAAVPFHGTEVTAVMGGAHIDLRRAVVSPGEEVVLDLFIVLGGCDLLIPAHWVVSAPVVAVMGGIDDKRIVPPPSIIADATAAPSAAPRLVIRGFVMMGGVTIRS